MEKNNDFSIQIDQNQLFTSLLSIIQIFYIFSVFQNLTIKPCIITKNLVISILSKEFLLKITNKDMNLTKFGI